MERDVGTTWYEQMQNPSSFVELTHRGEHCITSAFGQFEPNNFHNTTQQFPEFRIDYLPTRLFHTEVIHNAHLRFVRLYDQNKNWHGASSSCRSDIYHGICLPLCYQLCLQ
jgi:hypothetical protein